MDARRHGAPAAAPGRPLVEALRALGAGVRWGASRASAATVAGASLRGGEASVDAGESSQYLSRAAARALAAPRPTRLRVAALTSAPYVELTLRLIGQWGGRVERQPDGFLVTPGLAARQSVDVEGDFSAAAYPAAAAVLTGGKVTLLGLQRESAQGDRGLLDLLAAMGATVSWEGDEVRVGGDGRLRALDADLAAMPDQVPTLAALAPFASGTTHLRNVPHLRSRRAIAWQRWRLSCGAPAPGRELADGLVIPGIWGGRGGRRKGRARLPARRRR